MNTRKNTHRTGMLDSEKQNVQICFFVSESKLLSLKQLFVVLKTRVIVLVTQSEYSAQRFAMIEKLQLGLT